MPKCVYCSQDYEEGFSEFFCTEEHRDKAAKEIKKLEEDFSSVYMGMVENNMATSLGRFLGVASMAENALEGSEEYIIETLRNIKREHDANDEKIRKYKVIIDMRKRMKEASK